MTKKEPKWFKAWEKAIRSPEGKLLLTIANLIEKGE
ncbi:unnamed protein product, partial [marine sediment metagenome]